MEFLASLLPMILIFGLLYMMMIRPQQKQAKQKQEMINAMKPGDQVVTIGGLYGVVSQIDVANGKVEIDCEGVYLTFMLQAIREVVSSAPLSPASNESIPADNSQAVEPTPAQEMDEDEDISADDLYLKDEDNNELADEPR
ncbi:preprotein translocase subunit YajC [Eremococcus coleocola]|uniref:Preprotein translocase, YajC subunit n=1 Tax=Eremococcus coleocola ACS-139-V-Col8 TaxID=908337 RepID=E4KM07_9LACT|nr:preprotein translocase subunit YajC [Eremococcus coleocola]EFR32049.1 preprotein translocase, YajC subunit [Eremococcus coleocola ACS-139-V-Col8]